MIFRRCIAIALGLFLGLAVSEFALRASGFEFQLYPSKVQFGWPDPAAMRRMFKVDERLLWVPKDYEQTLAKAIERQPSHVYMGCSCTQWGRYDEAFAKQLTKGNSDAEYTFANLGVGGWSSYQGLQQMERDVVRIRPKLVTIYYGWNDHWITFGIEDAQIGRYNLEHPRLLTWLSERLRLVQLANRVLFRGRFRETPRANRVSLEDFRANLEGMVGIAQENGITPVLLTAPSAHEEGDEPVYVTLRWLHRKEDLVPVHRAYADVVREVAANTGAHLVDLLAMFNALESDERKALFETDGVHLNEEGNARIGAFLHESLKEADLLKVLAR